MSVFIATGWSRPRLRLAGGLCLWLTLAGADIASAANTPSYDALRERLLSHPSLQLSDASATQWRHSAAGALGLPDPSFTLGLNNLSVSEPTRFDRYLPSSKSLEVMQSIPSLAGREATQATLLARAGLAELERRQTLANLESQLITALAERRRIAESLETLTQQLDLLAELARWLRGEMEAGSAVYGRFDELDVRRARIEEQRLALAGEDQRWQSALRALIERVPDSPPPSIEPRAWDGAPEALIAVQVAERKVMIARAQAAERRAAFAPSYAIGAAYQQRQSGANFDGDDWFTLKATISLPLWANSNQRPKLAAAEAAVTRAMAERERTLREARNEFENALADYQTANDLLNALTQRAEKLTQLEAANRRRYEAGEGSLETVVGPAMQHVELERDQAKQQAKRIIAAARINALLAEDAR